MPWCWGLGSYLLRAIAEGFSHELESIRWIVGHIEERTKDSMNGLRSGTYYRVLRRDPCPFSLPEILTVAHRKPSSRMIEPSPESWGFGNRHGLQLLQCGGLFVGVLTKRALLLFEVDNGALIF